MTHVRPPSHGSRRAVLEVVNHPPFLIEKRSIWVDASGRSRSHGEAATTGSVRKRVEAVLFDRDGTLVIDVPYNGDPDRVTPIPGARHALDRLRGAGIAIAVVTNQSGVGRGLLTHDQVDRVHRRIEEVLGVIDGWFVCFHAPEEGCVCRKPRPALVLEACRALHVDPRAAVVIGDIESDIEAAAAAGVRAILVPTTVTLPEEIERAPECAWDLTTAVEHLLDETALDTMLRDTRLDDRRGAP